MADAHDYLTIYRRADGEPVNGEYDHVYDIEYFEDELANTNQPIDVIEEKWRLVSRRSFTLEPISYD
jgi:hypothetical protein